MNCRHTRPMLDTFADGELPPSEIIGVETHLEECARCRDQLHFVQAIKGSVQRVVTAESQVSPAFLSRLQATLLQAEQGEALLAPVPQTRAQRLRALFELKGGRGSLLSTLAAAAGVLLFLGVQQQFASQGTAPSGSGVASATLASAALGMEDTLDRLIDHHSSQPQPQVTEASLLPTFEPNVGVRIRLPSLAQYGAHWEGASLVPVVNHQAASLRYSMPGHRVTVYVFDPRKLAVRRPLERLERPAVDPEPVYVGQWRGYSVAAKERRGVGYAMAGDLDDQEILRLISSIH
jgi:anti-sigma factor RsiW